IFSRMLAVASFVALVTAGKGTNQCNTGTLQCCEQVEQPLLASDTQQFLSAFGLIDGHAGVTGFISVNCSPASVLGTGSSAQRDTQPIRCASNQMVGCFPYKL
ncbi:hydrophobin, partial [Pisolithus thermaeus]